MADKDEEESKEEKIKVKNASDLQRMRLEKLMKNPEKPVFIPEKAKEKEFKPPPEFVRNTWGSSAGAGSGEFHVYRAIRRREYARQKFLDEKLEKLTEDEKYHLKVQENLIHADERTERKRAKRLKKKQKQKQKKPKLNPKEEEVKDESEDDNEDETEEKEDDAEVPSFVPGRK